MRVSLKWLSEFVDLSGYAPDIIGDALTNAGLEVERIEHFEPSFKNVVISKILEIKPHPHADKLTLCKVTTGKETLKVVCGAKNIKEGDICPLVLPGGEINGLKIEKRKIRGEISFGMLCSERELGLGEDASGILILTTDMELGMDFSKLVGEDWLFEISITPNRGDCLSHIGIARELSAILRRDFKEPETFDEELPPSPFDVELKDKEDCPFYCGAVVEAVEVQPSPFDIRVKLTKTGIRAINNVVDITNLVLMEIGQPLHAFDMRFLNGKIIVRRAEKSEEVETIDERKRICDEDILLITDEKKAHAVAGIMGGRTSEIREDTEKIFFESAWFNPLRVRIGAKKLGLTTESSFRFERRVDPEGVEKGIKRALFLLHKLLPGCKIKGFSKWGEKPIKRKEIVFPLDFPQKFLGIEIKAEEITDILQKLGFEVEKREDEIIAVPPSWRGDISIKEDIAEEVARIKGYSKIPAEPLTLPIIPVSRKPHFERLEIIKRYVVAIGLTEVISYSFISSKSLEKFNYKGTLLRIVNPLSEEMNVLRPSPLYTLLEILFHNRRQKVDNGMVFEIGKGFKKVNGKVKEEVFLCGGIYGNAVEEYWKLPTIFFIKGIVEGVMRILSKNISVESLCEHHLVETTKSGAILVEGKNIGWFGLLNREILKNFDIEEENFYSFEISLDEILKEDEKVPKYEPFSRYPPVLRDISVVVNEDVRWDDVKNAIMNKGEGVVEKVKLFDIYRCDKIGKGKKSMSFHISLRSKEKTLKDEEIDLKIKDMVSYLSEKVGAKLRGEDE